MDIETYIECRVRPLSAYFERRAPVLARRNAMCEYAHLAANTAGAVLSVLMLGAWLPPTVAVAASFLGVTDYFYIPSQLEAANRAEQEVHNLLNWWESLSLVRRTRGEVQSCGTHIHTRDANFGQFKTMVSSSHNRIRQHYVK